MELLLQQIAERDYHRFEDRLAFTISRKLHDAYEELSGSTLASIIRSKPDGVIRLFDTDATSYASWTNHVVTSDAVKSKNWKTKMGRIIDQGAHNTCWAVVAAELVSALRFIYKHDAVYTEYSSQYIIDFVNRERGKHSCVETKHHCYKYAIAKALEFVAGGGIPLESHWRYVGCRGSTSPPNYKTQKTAHARIKSVTEISSVHDALPHLEFHPIGASLAIFEPDYSTIKGDVYRGPKYLRSEYKSLHAVSIYGITEEDGETIALVKSSHGEEVGDEGYFKVSLDVEMMEVPKKGKKAGATFSKPRRLLSRFCFPTLDPKKGLV